MATRLAASNCIRVYSRSPSSRAKVSGVDVVVHADVDEFFGSSDIILLMLRDDTAVNEVLGRGSEAFPHRVRGKLIVLMSTHAPAFSANLASEIQGAGGHYVEAPVSGSAAAASNGELAIMLAGEKTEVDVVATLLAPLGPVRTYLGSIPSALSCKLAVNCYLISTVAALGEALTMAKASGVDPALFAEIISEGPLGSQVARSKLAKMLAGDFAAQASITDVCKNAELVAGAAAKSSASLRMLEVARERFETVRMNGEGHEDMAAVIKAVQRETVA